MKAKMHIFMHLGRRDFEYQTTCPETDAGTARTAGLLEYSSTVEKDFHCRLALGLEIHKALKLYSC